LNENARVKLAEKNVDLMVANLVGQENSGFVSDTNLASLFYRDGRTEALPLMDKGELAHTILDKVSGLRKGRALVGHPVG
jgi:phosphopantothenoylcysteine decarboxylase/phosphopantothenate--cysteine ligase